MKKKLLKTLILLALFVLTILLSVWVILQIVKISEKSNIAEVPDIEIPKLSEIEKPDLNTLKVDLIKSTDNYVITSDPYSSDNYKKMSRYLGLIGDFEFAKLIVNGSLPNNNDHFLSINIGSVSGVYNAVRKSSDGLDISLTKENQGLFNKDNPINIKIDLLGQQTLSTTRKEFLETRETTKLVKLWDAIKPQTPKPSVSTILIAPFNKEGIYSGTINTLTFEYKCKEGKSCNAVLCGNDILFSQCINNNFGSNAKNVWVNWYGSEAH